MLRRNLSLAYNVRSREKKSGSRGNLVVNGSVPGDISGYDGRYGFSCEWTWTHNIPVPENWDGNPIPVSLQVRADDSATLTIGDAAVSANYDPVNHRPGESSSTTELLPGVYEASLSFTNIDYDPPSKNVAVLGYAIDVGEIAEIVPEENNEPPQTDPCDCSDSDSGGSAAATASTERSRAGMRNSQATSSSAGTNTRLETNATYARWQTAFGTFRGLGGIPAGTLEILAYDFNGATLKTSEALEWSHVFNSWLVLPDGGLSAGAQFKMCCGGSYTSWCLDGNGAKFFGVGCTKKSTTRLSCDTLVVEHGQSVHRSAFPGSERFEFFRGNGGNILLPNEKRKRFFGGRACEFF